MWLQHNTKLGKKKKLKEDHDEAIPENFSAKKSFSILFGF
jgi:hypothetical protein